MKTRFPRASGEPRSDPHAGRLPLWARILLAIVILAALLAFPPTRMLVIMILPIGVKPDDLIALAIIIGLVWYFVAKSVKRRKALKAEKTGRQMLQGAQAMSEVSAERATDVARLRAQARLVAYTLASVDVKSTLYEACAELKDALTRLEAVGDEYWRYGTPVGKVVTYHCAEACKLVSAAITTEVTDAFTDGVRNAVVMVAGYVNRVCDAVRDERLQDLTLDMRLMEKIGV